jgi:hypothetical protein
MHFFVGEHDGQLHFLVSVPDAGPTDGLRAYLLPAGKTKHDSAEDAAREICGGTPPAGFWNWLAVFSLVEGETAGDDELLADERVADGLDVVLEQLIVDGIVTPAPEFEQEFGRPVRFPRA